jgi:hypothetical protein
LDSIVKLNFFYTIHVDLSADSVALSHHPRITTLKWALLLCDKIRRKKIKTKIKQKMRSETRTEERRWWPLDPIGARRRLE